MRQVDPHVARALKAKNQYQRVLMFFLLWLSYNQLNPAEPEEFDDLPCEYKMDSWAGAKGRGAHRTSLR